MAQIHSTFSMNRHGRFQGSKLFEQVFERIVAQCLEVGLVRGELLAEGRKISGRENIASDYLDRPAADCPLLALMQTPHRFRTKRQLWTYSGLSVETHDTVRNIVMLTTAMFHRRAI